MERERERGLGNEWIRRRETERRESERERVSEIRKRRERRSEVLKHSVEKDSTLISRAYGIQIVHFGSKPEIRLSNHNSRGCCLLSERKPDFV